MTRIVNHLLAFVSGRVGDRPDNVPLNRIAQGSSRDRMLAAFKADQAQIVERHPDGARFAAKQVAGDR